MEKINIYFIPNNLNFSQYLLRRDHLVDKTQMANYVILKCVLTSRVTIIFSK
jgi:hypothetical protein